MNPATAIAQAVRPAGKPLNNDDTAEMVVADCQLITGGLALGMEAEMDGRGVVVETGHAPSLRRRQRICRMCLPAIAADSPTARRRKMMTDNGL